MHPLHHPSYCCRRLTVDCCILGPITDTVNANGIFVVIRDVAVLAILIIIVLVALSKGLVIAITLP